MYLGGNGLYWIISVDPTRPHVIELRRWGGTGTWVAGPGVDKEAGWEADELGEVIPGLLAKARPNSDGSGRPRG